MSDSPAVLARVRDSRHEGWLPPGAADVGTGEASTTNGDITRIQVRATADGVIRDAVFKVAGSNVAIASASLVTERLHGASVEDVAVLDVLPIVAELQLPLEHAGVAARAVDAARRAVEDWKRKQAAPRR